MANQSLEHLPEEARNYIQTINLQIVSITGFQYPITDYDHALADQVAALREHIELVKADPSICSLIRPEKRTAEDVDDIENSSALRPVRRARVAKLYECSTCLDSHPRGQVTILKCCKTVYCTTCFGEWFTAALSTKQLPKCCDIGIEPKDYQGKLDKDIRKQYKAIVKELEAERKLWCANMTCRAFIKVFSVYSNFENRVTANARISRSNKMPAASFDAESVDERLVPRVQVARLYTRVDRKCARIILQTMSSSRLCPRTSGNDVLDVMLW